jgi:hypothetical protein
MAENGTDDNSNPVDMDDFEAFQNDFYGRKAVEPEPKEEVEESEDHEIEDNPLAPEDEVEDSEEEQEDEETEVSEEPKPEAKEKKKSSLQIRIDELVADRRIAQEQLLLLQREFADFKARAEASPKQEPPSLSEQLPPEAPKPTDVDKEGNALYPLGEFDPKFVEALSKFSAKREFENLRKEQEQKAAAEAEARARAELRNQWSQKVEQAKEELPDFNEKVGNLVHAFEGVDPAYGDFLASTIMNCDNGPAIMYYLSQNIGEAQKIVASGAHAATFAIARISAQLEKPVVKEEQATPKLSEAPEPPVIRTRGAGGKFEVSDDTDDLAAFQRKFYNKK